MSRIKHPHFQPGRSRSLGIEFVDGYAEVDLADSPILSAALVQHGFEITVTPDSSGEFAVALDVGTPIVDLTKLKIADLIDIAETGGINVPAKATRPVVIDLISRELAARAIENPSGVEVQGELADFAVVELPDGTIIGDGKSIATLHEWIVPLEPGEE